MDQLQPGQRVAWMYRRGSYAERIAIPATALVRVPVAIDDQTAAAVMMQGLTASHFATDFYPVRPGDIALVHAAAGGVGCSSPRSSNCAADKSSAGFRTKTRSRRPRTRAPTMSSSTPRPNSPTRSSACLAAKACMSSSMGRAPRHFRLPWHRCAAAARSAGLVRALAPPRRSS